MIRSKASVFLLAGMMNCVFCISKLPQEEKIFPSKAAAGLEKFRKIDHAIYQRIQGLASCVVRVNRAATPARNFAVFFQRNSTTQELQLVTNFIKRFDHDVSVFNYGTGGTDFSANWTIQNVVVFVQNLHELNDIGQVLGQERIDRKGKFVFCISSTTWTEYGLVAISKFLWKWNVANAVLIVANLEGKVPIYSYTPMNKKKCIPSKVMTIYDNCNAAKLEDSKLFARKMRNMNLCPIVASSLNIGGAAHVYTVNGTRKVGGYEGTIFNAIAARMNFTRKITAVPPALWGDELPNGTWNGIHGSIMNGTIDVGFCLMIPVAKRLHFEEYSKPITADRYIWLVPKAMPTNWNKLLLPFQRDVWIATLVTFIVGLGVMHLTARGRTAKQAVLSNFLATTLGQSMGAIRGRRVAKFLILCWVLFSFVLTNAYQSGLVGFLTSTKNVMNYESVQQLIENNVPIGGAKTLAEFYNHPDDPDDYRIFKNYRTVPLANYTDFIFKILSRKLYFATLVSSVGVKNYYDLGNMHMMKEIPMQYPIPFVFPKGSPYINEFNVQITRLIEAGFTDHWYRSNETSFRAAPNRSHPAPLKFVHVVSVFGLWFIGLTISGITFLAEILCNGRRRRSPQQLG